MTAVTKVFAHPRLPNLIRGGLSPLQIRGQPKEQNLDVEKVLLRIDDSELDDVIDFADLILISG